MDEVSMRAVAYLKSRESALGIEVLRPAFGGVYPVYNGVVWRSVRVDLRGASENAPAAADREFSLAAQRLAIRLLDYRERRFAFEASGITLVTNRLAESASEKLEQRDIVKGKKLRAEFILDFSSRAAATQALRLLFSDAAAFLSKGGCRTPVEFSGTSEFEINGETVTVNLSTLREGGETILVIDRPSLDKVSGHLEEELTEEEKHLLVKNPLKAPRFLRIRDQAERTAKAAHDADPDMPEDPYRHVLWSYLLTNAFGQAFAEQATNAHEAGDDKESSADHLMDQNNNRIGREYALLGYSEADVFRRIKTDPSIIRFVSEVK